ncbi:MAG: hypothetical protein J6B75_10375 [Ruminococcus sp.]|nr:hypothetical protein [Ruminococcus sp.]
MSDKEKILKAWIMMEYLSEGDISSFGMPKLANVSDQDYAALLIKEKDNAVQRNMFKEQAHYGYAVYFDIFDFNEVREFLRRYYGIQKHYPQLKSIKEAGQFAQENIVNFMQNTT